VQRGRATAASCGDARGGWCAAQAERARPLRAACPSHAPRSLATAALGGARRKATVRSQARQPGGPRRWRSSRWACACWQPRSSLSACSVQAQVRRNCRPSHLCGALWAQQLAPDAVESRRSCRLLHRPIATPASESKPVTGSTSSPSSPSSAKSHSPAMCTKVCTWLGGRRKLQLAGSV
jgi:hypothetical protein